MLFRSNRTEQSELAPKPPRGPGRLRWRRFGAMMLVATGVTGALAYATAQGAIGAQFALSGLNFTVTASNLQGTGFEQFATLDSLAPNSPNAGNTGGELVLVVSAINSASLTNLCQSVNLGGEFLTITAGNAGTPVTASTLVTDGDQVQGDATFNNIEIGNDASTLTEVPGVVGNEGVFSQQADSVTINNLQQDNFATTAATFTLPNLNLQFTSNGCATTDTGASGG
jgi:Family of unknown function (DUF6230)